MGQLGNAAAVGVLSTQNRVTSGAWVVTFDPAVLPNDQEYECWHGAVRGPGGYFLMYLDDVLYNAGDNGLINTYSPNIPMFVRKGQSITLHWSITALPAPQVWLRFRQPEVGRL